MEKPRFNIAVRCRPLVRREKKSGTICADFECNKLDKKIVVEELEFEFDHVFAHDDDQNEVYSVAVKQLVTQVMKGGHNIAVLAYGQTNSGKTYTIGTDHTTYVEEDHLNSNQGIVPRVLRDIFPNATVDEDRSVKISFLEVYNDKMYDLLSVELERKPLQMIEEGNKPKGVNQIEVYDFDGAINVLVEGSMNRSVAVSGMNIKSSRSHAAFTIQLKKKTELGEKISQIMLVDLAGSETPNRVGTGVETFREGVSINSSLLALHGVFQALTSKARNVHVPYRNSTLTRLLKPYMEGSSHALMIACITPAKDCIRETSSTLRFASQLKQIKFNPNEGSTLRKRPYSTPWKTNKKTSGHALLSLSGLPQPQFADTPAAKQSTMVKSKVGDTPSELLSTLTVLETPDLESEKKLKLENSDAVSWTVSVKSPRVSLERMVHTRLCTPDRNLIGVHTREMRLFRKSTKNQFQNAEPLLDITHLSNTPLVIQEADTFDTESAVVVNADNNKIAVGQRRRSARLSVLSRPNYGDVKNGKSRMACKEEQSEPADEPVLKACPLRYGAVDKSLWCRHCKVKRKCIRKGKSPKNGYTEAVDTTLLVKAHVKNILDMLNSANLKVLQSLPCVGPKCAFIIRNWVHLQGKFSTIEDLKNVTSLPGSFYTRFSKANLCNNTG